MSNEILIRFIRGTHLDSRIIEFRTRAWCSHVEAVLEPDVLPRHTIGAMLKGGVEIHPFDDPIYNGVSRWEIWHIPCTPQQCTDFYYFLWLQFGKPYDWRAIISFGLGERDWRSSDSWFCSELIVAAGEAAGLWKLPAEVPCDRIDPGDAYLLFTILPGAYVETSNIK